MSIHETQYQMTLLGDALQGLGLSLSIHHTGKGPQITELHAQRLSHLVECCGLLATRLSTDLEDQIQEGAIPASDNGGNTHV